MIIFGSLLATFEMINNLFVGFVLLANNGSSLNPNYFDHL